MKNIFLVKYGIVIVFCAVMPVIGMDNARTRSLAEDIKFFENNPIKNAMIFIGDQPIIDISSIHAQALYPNVKFDTSSLVRMIPVDIKNNHGELLYSNIYFPQKFLLKNVVKIDVILKRGHDTALISNKLKNSIQWSFFKKDTFLESMIKKLDEAQEERVLNVLAAAFVLKSTFAQEIEKNNHAIALQKRQCENIVKEKDNKINILNSEIQRRIAQTKNTNTTHEDMLRNNRIERDNLLFYRNLFGMAFLACLTTLIYMLKTHHYIFA